MMWVLAAIEAHDGNNVSPYLTEGANLPTIYGIQYVSTQECVANVKPNSQTELPLHQHPTEKVDRQSRGMWRGSGSSVLHVPTTIFGIQYVSTQEYVECESKLSNSSRLSTRN